MPPYTPGQLENWKNFQCNGDDSQDDDCKNFSHKLCRTVVKLATELEETQNKLDERELRVIGLLAAETECKAAIEGFLRWFKSGKSRAASTFPYVVHQMGIALALLEMSEEDKVKSLKNNWL